MRLWQKKPKEIDYDKADALQEEAMERCRQLGTRIDRKMAEMKQNQDAMNDMRNGPGGPDDSAGKVRVCQ